MIDESFITNYIADTFADVQSTINWGYTFFFYRDDHMHAFATIASTGNEHEKISNLDRPGVYRLNIGVSRATFQSLFGTKKFDAGDYDFTALDVIMPHPDYSSQNFLCVLSPGEATFAAIRPLLAEAYDIAVKRYHRRKATDAT
ncbi:MAG TPA: DUF6194 family protein [Anaerolineae bacterium]|nr:DUF6194 family protein [Anaerolineae bacterium]HNU03686.1 DUF6194 family protein [Anaerolineae bacterium]